MDSKASFVTVSMPMWKCLLFSQGIVPFSFFS
jgi:hypothetical protein